MTAECGVTAVMIVGVQPAGEFGAAFGVAGVKAGVGPFVGQGAVKSFHFSVGLRSIGSGTAMFDAVERVAEAV